MEYNSQKKLTEKQKSARAKGRKHKKQKLGQVIHLEKLIISKDRKIFELEEKIKLLEGQLLLYQKEVKL